MESNIDNLRQLLDDLRSIGFWKRLFAWRRTKDLLIDAATDLQKLLGHRDQLAVRNQELLNLNSNLNKDLEILKEAKIRQAAELDAYSTAEQAREEKLLQLNRDNSSQKAQLDADKDRIFQLTADLKVLQERNQQHAKENQTLSETVASDTALIEGLRNRAGTLETALADTRSTLAARQSELNSARERVATLEAEENTRRQNSEKAISELSVMKEETRVDRQNEIEQAKNAEAERLAQRRQTWSRHQDLVKEKIKSICMTHTIEYVEKVPFRGEPDNTIRICGEFVIFDAKSPSNEDLKNFPFYLNTQADNAKKYAKQENVKSVIFFVIPSNTLESLRQYVYNLGDYDVFVIAMDSLEQIILSLKKIEEYEFAEALSPEDRDNICRVLAKFAHLTKRRIQIDSFFARQFIEMAFKAEAELPEEFLEKIVEYERSEKLNPPTERRTKIINTSDLKDDTLRLQGEVAARGIRLEHGTLMETLNGVELYENPSNPNVIEISEGDSSTKELQDPLDFGG